MPYTLRYYTPSCILRGSHSYGLPEGTETITLGRDNTPIPTMATYSTFLAYHTDLCDRTRLVNTSKDYIRRIGYNDLDDFQNAGNLYAGPSHWYGTLEVPSTIPMIAYHPKDRSTVYPKDVVHLGRLLWHCLTDADVLARVMETRCYIGYHRSDSQIMAARNILLVSENPETFEGFTEHLCLPEGLLASPTLFYGLAVLYLWTAIIVMPNRRELRPVLTSIHDNTTKFSVLCEAKMSQKTVKRISRVMDPLLAL